MRRILILALLLAMLPALPAAASLPKPLGADVAAAGAPVTDEALARVPALSLTLPDREDLAREDAARRAEGLPYRFALAEDVALTPANSGAWSDGTTDGAAGHRVWRLRVVTPGATSLNLGFARYYLPPSARLAVYPATNRASGLVWDAQDVSPHGHLWTPAMGADELVIELTVAAVEAHLVDLELGQIGRGYRGFGFGAGDKAGSCNVDVVCPDGDPWREEIKAVAVFSFGGSFLCTGAMINNTAHDGRPLFLTANHCGVSGSEASIVVYWNYESPTCGLQGGGDTSQSQSGSTVLASWSGTDFTLLELDDAPLPAFDVRWAGWDRRDRNNDVSVAIHQPSGDEKSISFDDDPTLITSYQGTTEPGNGTHFQIGAWDLGTTEPGSSGSPLFNEEHRITGQLHGGTAACDAPDDPDWYGRLTVSWDGGGAAGNRLSDHLDPLGRGVEYLDMLGMGLDLDPEEPARFRGEAGGPFSPEEAVYTLTNRRSSPQAFSLAAEGATFFSVQGAIGDIPAGGTRDFTISLSPSAGTLAAGTYRGRVRVYLQPGDEVSHEIDVVLTVGGHGVAITAITPNPSRRLLTVHYHLAVDAAVWGRVYDLRGLLIADLGSWSIAVGDRTLEWAARTTQGGLVSSGIYVFELEAGGVTSRQRFAIVR